jgi:hypothetical protein
LRIKILESAGVENLETSLGCVYNAIMSSFYYNSLRSSS